MKIKAYAKVNLGLKVLSKRENGYHNLATIMDLINLYDVIHIKNDSTISLDSNNKDIIDNNLILKAISIIKDECKDASSKGCKIYLDKKIPIGAGLGGGSSDAANVILALNKLWQLDLSFEKMVEIALKVGSDVPFFLLRSIGILSGIGENVNAIDTDIKLYYLLAIPNYPLFTKDVYANNHICEESYEKIDILINALNHNDTKKVIFNMFNDLLDAAISINKDAPSINDIICAMNNYFKESNIAAKAIMSGSGSCVFAAFTNKKDCLKALKGIKIDTVKLFSTKSAKTS